jgi:hypothetical protein
LTSPALERANLSGKPDAGKSYVVFGKIDSTAINLSAIASGTGGIGFTYALFTVYIGLINTNNQIIQAIAVDIACAGD